MSILSLLPKDINLDWAALATTDRVTGIYNRTAIELAIAHIPSYIAFFLDLNKFKPINDTAGHAAGDDVLKAIAQSLRTASGEDLVGRWGGDEFVLIVQCESVDIPALCQRIKKIVSSTPLDEYLPDAMAGWYCDVAVGYAHSSEGDAIALADERMYLDKHD